jgi:1,2-dihydroxy-3-keto-5-methylthiopentene dioxygenase
MAILTHFKTPVEPQAEPSAATPLQEANAIRDFLAARGIFFEQWDVPCQFAPDASPDEILAAYAPVLKPYMAERGYQTADVIAVHPETPNLEALRANFLKEHTHTEDEVRFFVEGHGDFWFHLPADSAIESPDVFCVRCERGDLLAVPAEFKHWFDLGDNPRVKAIRIFTDASGWTPHYTESGVDARYHLPGTAVFASGSLPA